MSSPLVPGALVPLALLVLACWLALPGGGLGALPRVRADPGADETHADADRGEAGTAPGWRWRAGAACGAGLGALLLLPGLLAGPAALVVGVLVWRRSATWEPAAQRRRRERVAADLPHVVDLLASCLAVGAAPDEALRQIVPLLDDPVRTELEVWVGRLRWGTDAVTVWTELSRHPQLGRLGSALRRSAESGAPVVEALDRLSVDLRGQRRAEVEERVRQIEVRAAVPLGVCLLPAFLLLGVVPLVAGSALRLLSA